MSSHFRIALLVMCTTSQSIKLRKIDQPILGFEKGLGRIQIDTKYYLHHFNITSIQSHVRKIRDHFDTLQFNQFTNLIVQKFNQIETNFNILTPSKRVKRWDTLGTIWKFLAGSPDANDLRIINSSINNLITNNNEQIKINRDINQDIKELIFQTKEAILVSKTEASMTFAINILLNLKFLSQKLEQIIESIALAKVGILNSKVLSSREIDKLVSDLRKENVTVHTPSEALNHAETTVASNTKEIVLLIKMPKLDHRIYRKTQVYAVWHDNKMINLRHRNYLLHPDGNYVVDSLERSIFHTDETKTDDSDCIPMLLAGKTARCNYTQNPITDEIIIINNQHILANFKTQFSLSSNCGMTNRTLSGAYLITHNNCTLQINNNSFSSTTENLVGDPINLQLDGVTIERQNYLLNLSLEHLHDLHIETRKELDYIKLENNSLSLYKWLIYGTLVLISIFVMVVVILYLCLRFHSRSRIKIQLEDRQPREEKSSPNTRKTFHSISVRDLFRTEPQH